VTQLFRIVSIFEGISYLVILGVTFQFISRDYVYILGMTHGVLFLVYLVLSLLVSNQKKWSIFVWLMLFVAAIIPFAFIPVEFFLKKSEESKLAEASA